MDVHARRGGIAAISAGGLVAIALIGPIVWGGLWLALVPATALLIVVATDLHAGWRPRDGRIGTVGALVLAVAAGGLLSLMIIGSLATADHGAEPAWFALPDRVAGYAFIAGTALFGVAALRDRIGPRWAGIAFAMSLPLGVVLDAATNLLPFGEMFFFAGSGFDVGMGLFALSLVRLGFAARGQPQIAGQVG